MGDRFYEILELNNKLHFIGLRSHKKGLSKSDAKIVDKVQKKLSELEFVKAG